MCGADNCVGFIGGATKGGTAALTDVKGGKKGSKKGRSKDGSKKRLETSGEECFFCLDGGELIVCSRKTCQRTYHLACLSLDGMPRGSWLCPWHFCDECGGTAYYHCKKCPNSYCKKHLDAGCQTLTDCGSAAAAAAPTAAAAAAPLQQQGGQQ